MSKHTPVPWAFKRVPVWAPTTPTEGIPVFEFCFTGGEEWMQRAKANAEFIVRAVNNHDALVKALKAALSDAGNNVGYEHALIDKQTADECFAVLAKAEGNL